MPIVGNFVDQSQSETGPSTRHHVAVDAWQGNGKTSGGFATPLSSFEHSSTVETIDGSAVCPTQIFTIGYAEIHFPVDSMASHVNRTYVALASWPVGILNERNAIYPASFGRLPHNSKRLPPWRRRRWLNQACKDVTASHATPSISRIVDVTMGHEDRVECHQGSIHSSVRRKFWRTLVHQ